MTVAEIIGLVGGIVGLVGGTLSIITWVEERAQSRRQDRDERAYQEWVDRILATLRCGQGNVARFEEDERGWATRAAAEGLFERGTGTNGLMLPRPR